MKKLFEQGNDFQLKTSVLNRNFLLHGMNKKSICQKECKQLFLAVYNTKMVIDSFNTEAQNKKLNISRLLELNKNPIITLLKRISSHDQPPIHPHRPSPLGQYILPACIFLYAPEQGD